MKNRIGYNVDAEHAGADRQYVANAQIGLQSTATLLMDDHKSNWFFSKQIAARSPQTIRICRTYMDGRDGDLWEAESGDSPTGLLDAPNYLNFLQNLHAPDGTYHQVLCESDVHGLRLKAKVKWLCEVVTEASRRGIRLCVDNVQPVTLLQSELDNGYYDSLWVTLTQHPEHLYGIHEYWLGDAWLNTSNYNMQTLAKNGVVDTQFLMLADSWLQANYVLSPDTAHLGRCEIIAIRCRKIGSAIPRIVYTEIGVDDVRLAQHDAVRAINGNREPMGYPTMGDYWHVHYPAWSRAQTFVEMCKWLNRSMPAYIVGACLFGFDTAFENSQYHLGDTSLQTRLQDFADSLDDIDPPPSTPPVIVQTSEQRLAALEADMRAVKVKLGL